MSKLSFYKKLFIFVIYFLLLFCINFMIYNKCRYTLHLNISAVDGATALFLYNNCYFGIIVPFTVMIIFMIRGRLPHIAHIVLFKTRKAFIRQQLIEAEQIIVISVLFCMLLNFAEYFILSKKALNWSDAAGLFVRSVELDYFQFADIIIALISTFVYAFLKLSVIYMIVFLLEVLFNNSSLILILLFTVCEYTAFLGNSLIGKYVSVKSFYKDIFLTHSFVQSILLYIFIYAAVCFFTIFIFKRKDLLR